MDMVRVAKKVSDFLEAKHSNQMKIADIINHIALHSTGNNEASDSMLVEEALIKLKCFNFIERDGKNKITGVLHHDLQIEFLKAYLLAKYPSENKLLGSGAMEKGQVEGDGNGENDLQDMVRVAIKVSNFLQMKHPNQIKIADIINHIALHSTGNNEASDSMLVEEALIKLKCFNFIERDGKNKITWIPHHDLHIKFIKEYVIIKYPNETLLGSRVMEKRRIEGNGKREKESTETLENEGAKNVKEKESVETGENEGDNNKKEKESTETLEIQDANSKEEKEQSETGENHGANSNKETESAETGETHGANSEKGKE